MDHSRGLDSLTEEKAAQLLDHAAKLDAQGGTRVSVAELREAALEAGISSESFERALADLRDSGSDGSRGTALTGGAEALRSPSTPSDSLIATVLRRMGIFVTGSVLVFFTQTLVSDVGMDSEPVMIFTLFVAALMVVWSAIGKRRDRALLRFEVDLAVLWTAMTFMLMLTNPGDVGEVLEIMMPAGFLASLVGGLVVATGPKEPEPQQLTEATSA